MDILVFKILTDVCFYMAMFMPLFLFGPIWVRVLLFLALASWCVWLLVCWKKRNMEERAHDSLMTEARLLLAAGCIQWLSLGTEIWGRRCVPFFTAFLVLGIFLLRALRLARTGQGRGGFWGRTAGELLAVLAAAGILSSRAVTGGLLYGLKFLYMTLVVPVLELMVRLLAGTLMGISWIFSRLFKDFSYEMPENALDGLMAPEALPGFEGTAASETPAFLKLLGTLAAAAALVLFFWFLYRMLSGRGRETDRRPAGTVRRSQAAPETGKRAGTREYMGDRGVRYYFRKFLKLCIAFQLPADERSASSETVCSDAVCSWGMEEEITALRDMYRKVRYGEKEETEALKREAREIYKKVKKKASER